MTLTRSPTWKRLENHWAKGFDTLMPEGQETIALFWLEGETMNGSLHQFFKNSSGDLALIALSGLQRLGASATLAALNAALAYFGQPYPVNREQRSIRLKEIEHIYGDEVFTPSSDVIEDPPEDFLQMAVDHLETLYQTQAPRS